MTDMYGKGEQSELPQHPILSVDEVEPGIDLRDKVPELIDQLSPFDRVVSVERLEHEQPQRHPSAIAALLRLTGAENPSEIGRFGPALASIDSPEHAGIPSLNKYSDVHGRDSLHVAGFLSKVYPELLRSTTVSLAELQGVRYDPAKKGEPHTQEEPGKIIHLSVDPSEPRARKFNEKKGWGWPFYGSIDATPLFVNGVYDIAKTDPDFLNQTYIGRDNETHRIKDALFSSVSWLTAKLDCNPEGLLEFLNPVEIGGIRNQAWRDSDYAYVHKDGSPANHHKGIAAVEVQGLAYDALVNASMLFADWGDKQTAHMLEHRAENLRRQILNIFWIEQNRGGYFALATDRDENNIVRPLEVRTSSMGHLLNSGVLDGDDPEIVRKREATIETLFSPEMLNISGIRTMSNREVAFRPGGYHTGSIWLWDNYYIAEGLDRHGYFGLSYEIKWRIWNVVNSTNRFLEHVRGGNDPEPTPNTIEAYVYNERDKILHLFEQPPQEIQAWTVAAMLAIKHSYSRLFSLNAERRRSQQEQQLPLNAVEPKTREFEDSILIRLAAEKKENET